VVSSKKSPRSRDALASIRDECATRNEPNWTILHNKLPPTPRVGLVGAPSTALHRPALILLFAKKFFRSPRRTNEVDRTNILAPGFTFFPPSPPKFFGDWPNGSRIQLQQRNCSRVSRDFLRRSTFPSSQRTGSRTTGLRSRLQDLFNQTSSYPCCHVERYSKHLLLVKIRDSSTLLGMTKNDMHLNFR
jgi:hypothetical protein